MDRAAAALVTLDAPRPTTFTRYRLLYLTLAVVALSPLAGCTAFQQVGTNRWFATNWIEAADRPVNQLATIWDGRVHMTQDSVNGGRPLPGLVGRVYLKNEGDAVEAQGAITVIVHDVSGTDKGAEPRALATWKFDAQTLKRLKRNDYLGEGYTLFLPWEEYHPAIQRVRVQVAYQPPNGLPHYDSPTTLNLQSDAPTAVIHQQKIMPTAHFPGKQK